MFKMAMMATGLTTMVLAGSTMAADAQEAPELPAQGATQTVETQRGKFHFSVGGGIAYQGSAGVDGGGRFSATRYSVGGGGTYNLNEKLDVNFGLGYERHDMRFSSVDAMGGDPWENVNIIAGQLGLAYHINDKWTIHGGGLVSVGAEDAAWWSRSVSLGAAGGVEYRVNDRLRVGVGLGFIERLEDTAALFPIFQFNWDINDQWTLRSGSFDLGVQGGVGIEAAWKPTDKLELAAGVQYQNRQFRLDRNGIAPDGVGEESVAPIYVKATWKPTARVNVTGFAGVLVGGRLELRDEDGHNITRKNFDPAPVFGGRVSYLF